MFRSATPTEDTILKREFNRWGIYESYGKYEIIIKTTENSTSFLSDQHIQDYKKKINDSQLESKNKNKFNLMGKTISKSKVHVCSNKELKEITIRLQPTYSGICIGEIKNKKFTPNLNFAEIIVNQNPKLSYPYVILEEKGLQLALYGRDIMGKSIILCNNIIKENQILLLLNENKEVIGIGKSRYNDKLITQSNKITIDNIQDIGTYYLKSENKSEI
jgi:60S ribosome subunit biogenesis protein NIP7